MFQKGNTAYKQRKVNRPGPGRPRSPIKPELDAIAKDKINVPLYYKRLSKIALTEPDNKVAMAALTYLIDRHEGKAKQVTDLTVQPKPFTVDDYELMAQVKIAERKLLGIEDPVEEVEIVEVPRDVTGVPTDTVEV